MEGAALPSPLPARASQGEGAGGFHDGGGTQMRPLQELQELQEPGLYKTVRRR